MAISANGQLYGWGTDKNTGRLGLGYEWLDKEKEDEKKVHNNRPNSYLTDLDSTENGEPVQVTKPVFLHYLNMEIENYAQRGMAEDKREEKRMQRH